MPSGAVGGEGGSWLPRWRQFRRQRGNAVRKAEGGFQGSSAKRCGDGSTAGRGRGGRPAPEPVPLEPAPLVGAQPLHHSLCGRSSARSLALLAPPSQVTLRQHSTWRSLPRVLLSWRVLVPVAATALPLRCPRPGSGRPSSCVLHGPPDGALTSGWPSARPSPQQRLASALLRSWGVPGYSCACSQPCFTGWPRGPQGWPEGGGAKVGRRSVPAWRLSVEHCPHPAPARSAARASAQSAGPLRRKEQYCIGP